MPAHLTTKQKCEKLATMLDSVAVKLRNPDMGEEIWEMEEPTIQALVSQITTILSAAKKISTGVYKDVKDSSKKKPEKDAWPNIIW